MSFVITLYVRAGIVMASDSRLTLTQNVLLPPPPMQQPDPLQQPDPQQGDAQTALTVVQQVAVGQTDSTYKTFLTPRDVGISTFGDAEIQGIPITGYIE